MSRFTVQGRSNGFPSSTRPPRKTGSVSAPSWQTRSRKWVRLKQQSSSVKARSLPLEAATPVLRARARPPSPSSTIVVAQSAPAAQRRKRSRVPSRDLLSTTTISFDIPETELIDTAMESRQRFNASRRFLVQTMMLRSTRLPTEAWPSVAWRDNARGASKFPQKPIGIAQFADPLCEN